MNGVRIFFSTTYFSRGFESTFYLCPHVFLLAPPLFSASVTKILHLTLEAKVHVTLINPWI